MELVNLGTISCCVGKPDSDVHAIDGTGNPLVHLTTPIYTNVVKGKLKKGIEFKSFQCEQFTSLNLTAVKLK